MSYADDVTIGCARGFGEIYSDPDFLNAYGNYTLANAACAAAWQTETEAEGEEYRCVEEDEELEEACERVDGQLCTMRVEDGDSGSSLLLRLCLPDECSGDEFNDDDGASLFALCDNCSVEISCGGLSTGLLLLVILLPTALLLMAIAAWYSWRRRQHADAAGQASVEDGAKSEEKKEEEEEEEEEEGTATTMSHETEMTSGTTT